MIPFGAIQVIESQHWPMEHYADEIRAIEAPRWFARVLRFFGVSPFVCWVPSPLYRPKDPILMGNRLVCHPSQARALRDRLPRGVWPNQSSKGLTTLKGDMV